MGEITRRGRKIKEIVLKNINRVISKEDKIHLKINEYLEEIKLCTPWII